MKLNYDRMAAGSRPYTDQEKQERIGATREAIELAEREIRQNLKVEYEAKEKITKRVDELEEIVALAIAACQDRSPYFGNILLDKAERIFGKALNK